MRTRIPNPFQTAALFSTVLALSSLLAFDFEGGHTVTLVGFETRGAGKDGKEEWQLHGEKARLRGGLYQLDRIRLVVHLENNRRATVTSPKCMFDQTRGIAHSDAPLHVVSEEMTLEGVGYDIAADRKVLRIRSQVKMTVRKVGGGMSPEDVFGPLGGTPESSRKKSVPKPEEEQK